MPDYKEDLLKDLRKSPRYAAKYLSAAAADSPEAFLVRYETSPIRKTEWQGWPRKPA